MRPDKYVLDEQGNPLAIEDLMIWAEWLEHANRRVARDKVGNCEISTVFLGLDHNWTDGPPLLWETMLFSTNEQELPDELRYTQWRYSSREAAEGGHVLAVEMVRQHYRPTGTNEDDTNGSNAVPELLNQPRRSE